MFKALSLCLLLSSSVAMAAYPIGVPGVYDPILPRNQLSKAPMDDLMSPDEIAAEAGVLTQEQKWMNGDYSDILVKAGRQSGIENRPLKIEIIKEYQVAYVYQYGQITHQFLVSTGRNQKETAKSGKVYRSATPAGVFSIDWMTKNHRSQTWDADMPYAMFFNGGIALHATFPKYYGSLGRPTGTKYIANDGSTQVASGSGGCVRFTMEDAETIYNLVLQYKRSGTVVVVKETDGY